MAVLTLRSFLGSRLWRYYWRVTEERLQATIVCRYASTPQNKYGGSGPPKFSLFACYRHPLGFKCIITINISVQ